MRRRDVLAGGLGLLSSRSALAQRRTGIARIGYLSTRSMETPDSRAMVDAFQSGMREHGYVVGRDILIEFRGAESRIEQFPQRARELVDLNPDLIVATNSLAARAVQSATADIPIVVPVMGDPVGDGLVASLARPGPQHNRLDFSRSRVGAEATCIAQRGTSCLLAYRRIVAPRRLRGAHHDRHDQGG